LDLSNWNHFSAHIDPRINQVGWQVEIELPCLTFLAEDNDNNIGQLVDGISTFF